MASEGPALACTAFLQWQSRMYQKTLRSAALAAAIPPNENLHDVSTDAASGDDNDIAGSEPETSSVDEADDL